MILLGAGDPAQSGADRDAETISRHRPRSFSHGEAGVLEREPRRGDRELREPVEAGAVPGRDAMRAMRLALQDAALSTEEIELVNAHGSSTPLNDRIETRAIKEVFGERARRIPVSGTKGMHAHALGASGAMEAAIAALSVSEGYLPATANLDHPDPECDLDYVPRVGRAGPVRTLISNSFGFGGTNACLVLKTTAI